MKPVERDFDRRHAILPAFFLVVGIGMAIRMTMMGLDRDHYFFYGEPPSSCIALAVLLVANSIAGLIGP